jgi:hypothetical protein
MMCAAMLLAGVFGCFAAVLISAPVYGLALWLLGAFGAEEIAFARQVLGRTPPAS